MTGRGYAFRDTEAAAGRLGLLAELWEPSSRHFLESCAPRGGGLAYDLGCGPGWTTRLLAEVAAPRRVVGLDESPAFVERARRLQPGLEFELQDVTRAGFPSGPADLAYCRMLLTHLPDPEAALAAWSGDLRPGGTLLVDEVEAIATEDPVFARYLEVAAQLIAARAGRLYVGAELDAARPAGLTRIGSRATELSPPRDRVAELFGLNLGVWRDSPDVAAAPAELDEVAAALGEPRGRITWTMRQIAYRRP